MEKIAMYVHNFMNRRILNNSWTQGDSDTFVNAAKAKGWGRWKEISKYFQDRTAGAVREYANRFTLAEVAYHHIYYHISGRACTFGQFHPPPA
jgi:hypothetical protein